MIKYKKLKIKNEEEVEELNINDIRELAEFSDIRFRKEIAPHEHSICLAYLDNPLERKVAKLSKKVDWIIREYEGELYLIPLKKDC